MSHRGSIVWAASAICGVVLLCIQTPSIGAVPVSRNHGIQAPRGFRETAHLPTVFGRSDAAVNSRVRDVQELAPETASSYLQSPQQSPYARPNRPQRVLSNLRSSTSRLFNVGQNRFRKWWRGKRESLRHFMRHRLPGHVDRLRTWFTPFFASPTFRDDAEPGKHIIAGLISEMASGLANLVTVPSIDGDSETENRIQEAVRRSLRLSPLDAGQEIAVTSENTGGTRVFQVGGLVAQGTDGVAFQVTDLETNSHRVLKGFVMRAPETERQITERIIRLGRVLQKSWRRMSADDALTKLRFLAPQDFVRFAEADDPFLVVGIVPNAFFVYPHPATSLDRVLLVMREDERVRTSAGARLLLLSATTQVIRLAACYHTLGLVHGHLHPGSFFVSEDGRLLLGSSRDVYQQGGTYDTVRHRSMLAAPEFTSHRFTYTYGYDSWQLGVILYYLWCGQYPHGLGQSSSVPHADSSTELSFSSRDCLFAPVPSPVQNLIQAFLQRSRWRRVLARKAFSSEDYKRVVAATLELVGELESDPGSQ